MSQFWVYIKTDLRTNLKQAPMILGVYLLIPVFFSLLMGYSFNTAFVPDASIHPIEVSIANEDEGNVGEMLINTLTSEAMSDYIDVVEEEDEASFHLTIQPDYSERLSETLLTIESKEHSSVSEENLFSQILTQWQQAYVNQEHLIADLATVEDLSLVNPLLISLQNIEQISSTDLFNQRTYESATALNSYQFTAVAGILFIFFTSISTSVNITTPKVAGLRKRINVAPISAVNQVLYQVTSNMIIFSIVALLYIVTWRIINASTFIGNPLFYLFWVIVYVLFFQAMNAVMSFIIPDKWRMIIYQILIFFFMIFGFLPLDQITGGAIAEFFNENIYRQIFNQPFYDYMIYQDFTQHLPTAVGLVLFSLVLIAICIFVNRRKEMKTA